MAAEKVTPLMKQYNQIKAKHPSALLLFRVGDFYETFGEDAIKTSKILGIVLTGRNNGGSKIELAGFPHHSLDTYLPKLVRAGERVAICDQLEDPKLVKGIVKRGVTELVTPGITLSDQVLEQKKNNFLCAIHFGKELHGISFLDISTGEFLLAEGNLEYIDKLINGFAPNEIIFQKKYNKFYQEHFGENYHSFRLEDWIFQEEYARESLTKHFETKDLKGFGVDDISLGIIAAGAILFYLSETQHHQIGHITNLNRIEEENYVWLDRFTIRNLELVSSQNERAVTLIDILDKTLTPMGGRMLKRWLMLPLKKLTLIHERLDAVQHLYENETLREELTEHLSQLNDLERIVSKVAVGKVSPKEIKQLQRNLLQVNPIKNLLFGATSKALKRISEQLNPCETLIQLIDSTLDDDPANQLGKGKIIKDGFNPELDELRKIAHSGKSYLEEMREREIEKTGISSLKINQNNVFGYYLEVTHAHKDKVPEDWIRKQTLVNAERYITQELKEYETKVLGAEEKIYQLEAQFLQDLTTLMIAYTQAIQLNAHLLASLDCLVNFAVISVENNYHYPEVNDGFAIDIKEGRHPVIEKQLKNNEPYITNDVYLDNDQQQIIMLTGPNMSGKSAVLRQTAIICLMAQMGCFVPATSAKIGYLDKVFTRVGASDNISSGESTFMVEMNETSSILNNLSERSLILLDEIGRGTSTYDGISIAWAIASYLHEHPKYRAKTLFATHYHELNDMYKKFSRIKNYNISVKEVGNKILFLRKLVEGGSEHSFGIHVAKLAGMPTEVIATANQMLAKMESNSNSNQKEKIKEAVNSNDMQLSFFQLNDPVLEQIRDELVTIDINTLTPVEALMKLNEIKKLTGG